MNTATVKAVMDDPRVKALFAQGKTRVQVGTLRFEVNPAGDLPTLDVFEKRVARKVKKEDGARKLFEWVKLTGAVNIIDESSPCFAAVARKREQWAAQGARMKGMRRAKAAEAPAPQVEVKAVTATSESPAPRQSKRTRKSSPKAKAPVVIGDVAGARDAALAEAAAAASTFSLADLI